MSDKYITRAELRLSPYNIAEDVVDNKYLEVLQDLCKDLVDRFCIQDFELEGTVLAPVEKKVDGTGKDTVFIDSAREPKRLVDLVSVRVYSTSTNYTEFLASEFVTYPKYISWNIYSEYIDSARLRVENFTKGNANIGILGTWGWTTVPNPIKYLQGMLIKKIVEDASFAERLNSERIGDYSYDLAIRGEKEFWITGDRQLDVIIKRYRETVFGVKVV
ncbi:hypothetical protein ACFL2J_05575 [Candidatus Omnitrophota bacterium]